MGGVHNSRSINSYGYAANNPYSFTDPNGLLDVHVWSYRGSTEAWGHVSITLDNGTHISWWPSSEGRHGSLASLDIYSAPANPNQTFADDVRMEEQRPDFTVHITGLNESAIQQWWEAFKGSNEWSTLGQNCSTTVSDALKAGGGSEYASWWSSHNFVWTPDKAKAFAESINKGVEQKRQREEKEREGQQSDVIEP